MEKKTSSPLGPAALRTPATASLAKTAPVLGALANARKEVLLLFAPFTLLLILSLLLIGLRVSVGKLAKDITALETHTAQLQDQNNRALARAEQLASYSRIARLAHERLGLVGLAPKLIVVSSE